MKEPFVLFASPAEWPLEVAKLRFQMRFKRVEDAIAMAEHKRRTCYLRVVVCNQQTGRILFRRGVHGHFDLDLDRVGRLYRDPGPTRFSEIAPSPPKSKFLEWLFV